MNRVAALFLSAALLGGATAPMALADPHGCPPGLAKKGCMPPGQAKKYDHDGHRGRDDHAPRYRVGYPIPSGVDYVIIRDYDRYGLRPPARGERYVRVDNEILRVADTTYKVLAAVQALNGF
ncbi:RcnB family protein [Paroceanicella profunda]|nr:RcnB family protein [Paroceanicella profunda]